MKDLRTTCELLIHKTNIVELEQDRGFEYHPYFPKGNNPVARSFTENGFYKNLTLSEQITKKLLPLLEEISRVLVQTTGENETFTKPGEEEDYTPDMRAVIGYLN